MIENKQQSAVEWYSRRLFEIEIAYNQGVINTDVFINSKIEAKQQAQEMHKEQIIDAYWDGGQDVPLHINTFKQYYNETYGGNK
jgi:hypothetical protein